MLRQAFGCSAVVVLLTWTVLYFAVIRPSNAQLDWVPTRCHVDQASVYQCRCTVDQYGYMSCATCEDLLVSYSIDKAALEPGAAGDGDDYYFDADDAAGVTTVQVMLYLTGRTFWAGQTVKCIVNPEDLTDVRMAWSYPYLTIWIFGLLSFLPCLCTLGVAYSSCVGEPRRRRRLGYGSVDTGAGVRQLERVALFGPVGVGKRALLSAAGASGVPTFDLVIEGRNYTERLHSARQLFASQQGLCVFGAADLRVEDFPGDVELVLLLPPLDAYRRRFRMCCEARPEERAQDGVRMYREFERSAHRFDRVLTADLSPSEAVDWVLSPYGRPVVDEEAGGQSASL